MLKDIKDPKIVALGLTYKPNTYDIRESPAIEIIENLRAEGYHIEAYDPFMEGYEYTDLAEVVDGKDCLVVLVEHDEIKKDLENNLEEIKSKMKNPIIFRPAYDNHKGLSHSPSI